MEDLPALWWSKIPRWARGLVLGNFCFFTILGIGLVLLDSLDLFVGTIFFMPTLLVMMAMLDELPLLVLVYYAIWCVCGALLVRSLGEVTGTVALILSMFALNFLLLLYFLSIFSFSW